MENPIRRIAGEGFWAVIVLLILVLPAFAAHRSQSAKRHFAQQHPCPATGKPSASCPGYVIDHICPLACGGQDEPSNMQWQTIAQGKAKDKVERKECVRYCATGSSGFLTPKEPVCRTVPAGDGCNECRECWNGMETRIVSCTLAYCIHEEAEPEWAKELEKRGR